MASPRATFPPKKDRTIWTPNLEKIGKSFFCQRYLHANFYVLRKIVASDMVIWVASCRQVADQKWKNTIWLKGSAAQ